MLNATFINISVISLRLVLLLEETRRSRCSNRIILVVSLFRMLLYVGVHYWRPDICRWRMKFHDGFENIPISLQQSLSYAHDDFYPNIKRLYFM